MTQCVKYLLSVLVAGSFLVLTSAVFAAQSEDMSPQETCMEQAEERGLEDEAELATFMQQCQERYAKARIPADTTTDGNPGPQE